eukprot:SAG11_NODE_9047_length_949_cov_1.864706_2_plen_58_part_01
MFVHVHTCVWGVRAGLTVSSSSESPPLPPSPQADTKAQFAAQQHRVEDSVAGGAEAGA